MRIHSDEIVRVHGDFRLRSGGGSDEVDVQSTAEFMANVGLGGGSDSLMFSPLVSVTGTGRLNGGGGFDSITSHYAFAAWLTGDPTVSSFELFM